MYLPNPECSNEENDIIASKYGNSLRKYIELKSLGWTAVILGSSLIISTYFEINNLIDWRIISKRDVVIC